MIPGIVASGAGVSAFTPASLTGLRVWLDATQMGLNDGDAVGTWSDLSGGGRDATQGTAGNKPTYKTGIINGKPIVRFDGFAADRLAFGDIMTGVAAATAFLVVKIDADPPGAQAQTGLWHFGGLVGGSSATHYPYTDGTIYDQFGASARKTVGNPTPSLAAPRIYGVVTAPSDWRAYLDGTLLFSTATNTVSWKPVPLLGASFDFAEHLDGDVGEFIIYDTALGTTDRQAVEAYLKAKWGIA